MSLSVFYEILNQKDTPAIYADSIYSIPNFGFVGRLFIAIDTKQIFRDYGDRWELIADAGSGSSNLQQVTTNGNYTSTDIDMLSGNLIYRKLSTGSVLFINSSDIVTEDNTNFFWDDTNNRLGLGTNTPTAPLDVHSSGNIVQQLNGTSTNNTYLAFLNQDIGKWRIGNYYNSNSNDFVIYDTVSGVTRAFFTNTGYTIFPTNMIIGSSNRSSAYGLDSYVSANFQSTLRVQGASTFLSQINGTFGVFSGDLTVDTNTFYVDSTNNRVGIGTINPASKLTLLQSADSLSNGLRIYRSNGSDYQELYMSSGFGAFNDPLNFYSSFSGGIVAAIDRSGKAYFKDNVLIGTTTDNGSKLQVSGDATISNSATISKTKISSVSFGTIGALSSSTATIITAKSGNISVGATIVITGLENQNSGAIMITANVIANWSGSSLNKYGIGTIVSNESLGGNDYRGYGLLTPTIGLSSNNLTLTLTNLQASSITNVNVTITENSN